MDASLFVKQRFQPPESGGGSVSRRGSRRRNLWELQTHVHCPVIGVCLPLAVLRRIAEKAGAQFARLDDYALHSAAVQLARGRELLTESIQDELENRYAVDVRKMRALKSTPALAAGWAQAVESGEIAGALWATLTHPACDSVLAEQISQQMHMIQHQAGAALRLDIGRLLALQDENVALSRHLADAQARVDRLLRERNAEIEGLMRQVEHLRIELAGREAALAGARKSLADRSESADRPEVESMRQQLVWQGERAARLELENFRLRRALAAPPPPVPVRIVRPRQVQESMREVPADLGGQRILCVGGRESVVTAYRRAIETAGGAFIHHDGGVEDRLQQLDSVLGAADMVICQTGCISHNAYWRVKDYCKRTGKRCAFVENPSMNGFMRGLHGLLQKASSESMQK